MMTRMDAQVRLRIDIGAGASIGPGKVDLLEAIDRCGSLSAAARELRLSYRRAWLLLDDLNGLLDEPLVFAAAGGRGGGGARLSSLGSKVVERYRRVEAAARRAAKAEFGRASGLKPRPARSRRLRRPIVKPLA